MVYWPNNLQLAGVHDVKGVADFVDVKWMSDLEEGYIYSPTVADEILYLGGDERKIIAVDARTGDRLWEYQAVADIVSGIMVHDGIAYFADNADRLVALALDDQMVKWAIPVKRAPRHTFALPVVSAGTVYFGSRDRCLHALDAATGKQRWMFPTKGEIRAPATVGPNGIVYVGSFDNRLYAVDANTGAMKWNFRTSRHVVMSAPAVAGGMVYFGSNDFCLYALDAQTGELRWTFKSHSWLRTFPAVHDGVVYFASYHNQVIDNSDYNSLFALDARTGEVKWCAETVDIHSGPHIADGRIFISTLDGLFHALDLDTGRERWHFGKEGGGISGPAFSDGAIYIAGNHKTQADSYAHYLYALRTEAAQPKGEGVSTQPSTAG